MNYFSIDRQISKYGRDAVFFDSRTGYIYFHAFLQPLRYKNKIYLRGKYTEIGKNKEDYYLYIGPPGVDISEVNGINVKLMFGGESYLVYRTERHCIKNDCVYIWAIIRPAVMEDTESEDDPGEEVPIG